MERLHFKTEDVIGFLEWLISNDMASVDELEMYEDWKWDDKLDRNKHFYTYKRLLKKLKREYNN